MESDSAASAQRTKNMKLKYLLGYTDDVTAKEVGISANSIAKYVSRARKKLAAMIYSK